MNWRKTALWMGAVFAVSACLWLLIVLGLIAMIQHPNWFMYGAAGATIALLIWMRLEWIKATAYGADYGETRPLRKKGER